jgi:hypothetical protein
MAKVVLGYLCDSIPISRAHAEDGHPRAVDRKPGAFVLMKNERGRKDDTVFGIRYVCPCGCMAVSVLPFKNMEGAGKVWQWNKDEQTPKAELMTRPEAEKIFTSRESRKHLIRHKNSPDEQPSYLVMVNDEPRWTTLVSEAKSYKTDAEAETDAEKLFGKKHGHKVVKL